LSPGTTGGSAPDLLDTVYAAETPEGIALSLSPAGPVPRVLAYLIDTVVRVMLWTVTVVLARAFGGAGPVPMLALISVFAIEWIYPIAFELSMSGATPGKKAMGLQVAMESGLPVTPAASVTRNLLRVADFLPFLYAFGLVSMLLRRDFKRLGDLAAGTLVVHSVPVSLHADFPPAPAVAPPRPLTRREQAAVVSWAGRALTLTADRFAELARLARPLVSGDGAAAPAEPDADARRLLGIAHWLVGNRDGGEP
jgi:uncharacterized RDD family membrane protein YckC